MGGGSEGGGKSGGEEDRVAVGKRVSYLSRQIGFSLAVAVCYIHCSLSLLHCFQSLSLLHCFQSCTIAISPVLVLVSCVLFPCVCVCV
jgi:hypothetical protein